LTVINGLRYQNGRPLAPHSPPAVGLPRPPTIPVTRDVGRYTTPVLVGRVVTCSARVHDLQSLICKNGSQPELASQSSVQGLPRGDPDTLPQSTNSASGTAKRKPGSGFFLAVLIIRSSL